MEKYKREFKFIKVSVLLSIMLVFMLFPIYTNNSLLSSIIKSCRTNNEARIDIKNQKNREIKVLSETTAVHRYVCENEKGSCSFRIIDIDKEWQEHSAKFEVVGDGKVEINLRGPDERNENDTRYPVIVDYKYFSINGKPIFEDAKECWHDNSYKYSFSAKNGDVIELKFQVRKHLFRYETFKKISDFSPIMFLSVLILSFLFSYGIVRYVLKFKEAGNSWSDIVFVGIFAFLLIIPMSHISQAQKSELENRMYAKSPSLFVGNNFNPQYAKQFEEWFNDRFNGRNLVITLYKNIMSRLNKYYSVHGFRRYKNDWLLNNSQLQAHFSEKQVNTAINGIKEYQKFCKEHNIKCYMEIAPRKLEFCKKEQFRIVPETELDNAQIVAERAADATGFNIIYPLEALKKASQKDFVYFKTDHHWTEYGAFIGYQELMKAIKKDFPDLTILTEDDYDIFYSNKVRSDIDREFKVGYTCEMLMLSGDECPLYTNYKYYRYKKENEIRSVRDKIRNHDFYTYFAPNKQKVMIIGNSYVENISYFLAPSFERVFKRRYANQYVDNLKLSRWKDEIINKKIDILIILFQSEECKKLQDLKD